MAIDQSKLGKHVQEQMAAIEEDPGIPDDLNIGAIITIVELGKEEEGDSEGQKKVFRNLRVRTNVPPTVAIGLLEEAKAIQLGMLGGSA